MTDVVMQSGVNSSYGKAEISYVRGIGQIYSEEKEIEVEVGGSYGIDISKLHSEVGIEGSKITLESERGEIAGVEGLYVKGIKEGRTKIKVKDGGTESSCYIYVNVVKGKKEEIGQGEGFTVALKRDGTVWSWGRNEKGQLGTGDRESRSKPTKVKEGIKDISVGKDHVIAIGDNGKIYVWGGNEKGQLGIGDNTDRLAGVELGGITGEIKKVEAKGNETSILTKRRRDI